MDYLTLQETCRLTGVTRRAIQGYEKAGLVSAVGRNQRGCLLYDAEARELIKRVKLYQKLGFSIREIQELVGLPEELFCRRIMEKTKRLAARKAEIDLLIQEAYALIREPCELNC